MEIEIPKVVHVDYQRKVKRCTSCGNDKSFVDFHKSRFCRGGVQSECKECTAKRRNLTDRRNVVRGLTKGLSSEEIRLRRNMLAKAYRDSDKERTSEVLRKWRNGRRWKIRASAKVYYEKNKYQAAERCNRRRAAKVCATPSWANIFFMQEAYSLARLRTKIFGFKWHVDHIVPLRSNVVCGLHVENNLQVIPATENLRKYNTVWPDMP